jgi:phosphoribosyl 1,2-cyclic phosphodiesterase
MLTGCQALVLECNHDRAMLSDGPYPPALKRRVASNHGHLDNSAAASLLRALDTTRLQHIIAAHLSRKNNTPQLAQRALADALDCGLEWIGIADQGVGFDWREIS